MSDWCPFGNLYVASTLLDLLEIVHIWSGVRNVKLGITKLLTEVGIFKYRFWLKSFHSSIYSDFLQAISTDI